MPFGHFLIDMQLRSYRSDNPNYGGQPPPFWGTEPMYLDYMAANLTPGFSIEGVEPVYTKTGNGSQRNYNGRKFLVRVNMTQAALNNLATLPGVIVVSRQEALKPDSVYPGLGIDLGGLNAGSPPRDFERRIVQWLGYGDLDFTQARGIGSIP